MLWSAHLTLRRRVRETAAVLLKRYKLYYVGLVYSGYGSGSLTAEVPGAGTKGVYNLQKFQARVMPLVWFCAYPKRTQLIHLHFFFFFNLIYFGVFFFFNPPADG